MINIKSICTTDFGSIDKQYQENLLPNGLENILVLAKRIQDKYVKTKAVCFNFTILINKSSNNFINLSFPKSLLIILKWL